jgi:hypothetical protein
MNGLIKQWGIIGIQTKATWIPFLVPFTSSTSYTLVNGVKSTSDASSSYRGVAVNYNSIDASDSELGFTVYSQQSSTQRWLAIGY